MAPFTHHVVIITGAGSGIGRATSIRLASAGANLALSDIDSGGLETTLHLCREAAAADLTPDDANVQRHMASSVDIRSTEAVNAFVASVADRHQGRIDHVFNCAGINPTNLPTEHISDEYWQRLVDTNLKGTFAMTRACIPHMRRGGSFVNVSSVCGLYPTAGFAVYCATKYAVIGFSKCMALELGERGIRVNVVAPGIVETPTNVAFRAGSERVQKLAKEIGLKRTGTPEEIADVVAFLFSEESRFMNGSVVEVDGGIGIKQ
ncbi:hypothetical protein PV08_02809 [Exophiala spinifera]|uniref:Ketoreductase domain-containing protein n=1 Tax=Exophiala spinifera TaxID=91928 RepID=A0A0D1YTI5_9EURO|nr:uncharacterized protein PV08_02809 [Exophiala spinifera]KIW18521.1 hypothetical protein PV08_02809 [Exophiala spinifera]